jgi:biopolymer transport protein ExbD
MSMDPSEPLSAAQRSKIRRLAVAAAPEPGDEAGELNVVPYLDIIMNVMMFVLASVTVAFTATIPTTAQASVRPGPTPPDALSLTALITSQGVALKTAAGSIAPGCGDTGPGVTIPKVRGEHDLAGLSACARRIKGARPQFAGETQVAVSASPDVPYQEVIGVMDALRHDEDGELFPDARLGLVR